MSRLTWLLLLLLASACAAPPNKEMDQAQGAIDAARAAGADRYAATTYDSAVEALKSANAAVAQGDYRLALNHAIESRERAQDAAREGAEARARLRSEVERTMSDVAGLMAQASTRLEAARKNRRARQSTLDQAAATVAAVNRTVQKAGEAIKEDDYGKAGPALSGVKARMEQAIASIESAVRPASPRRRR